MKKIIPLFAIFLILASCTSQPEAEVPEKFAGLENLTLIQAENTDTLHLRPRQTYGSTDTVLLGAIGAIAVNRKNRVYLQDRNQKFLYAYDPDGRIIGRMGGSGRGPGEFSLFGGLNAAIRGNLLYVDDRTRSNAFDLRNMAFSHTVSLRPSNQESIDSLENHNTAGHHILTDSTLLMGFREPGARATPDNVTTISYHIMDHEGTILSDRILELPDHIFYRTTMDGSPRYATFSFTPLPKMAVNGQGHIYATRGDHFLIKRYDAAGTYLGAYYFPYERAPIDRSRLLEDYDNEVHRKMIRSSSLPEHWPAIDDLRVDGRNRLWVRVIGEHGEQSLWWVINENGERIGLFREPAEERVRAVRNGHIYTLKNLESGVQVIQRYRVL